MSKVKEEHKKENSESKKENSESKKENSESKKERIDFTSRFICTVYKPLYYILLPLIFVISLDVVTTVNFNTSSTIIYWIVLIILIAVIFIEYFICRSIRKKKDRLDEKQLTVGKKFKNIFIILLITVVLDIIIPVLHIAIFGGYLQ